VWAPDEATQVLRDQTVRKDRFVSKIKRSQKVIQGNGFIASFILSERDARKGMSERTPTVIKL
jgi:hypothetical protein